MQKDVYYSDYLQLDKILGAQQLESEIHGNPAHDEMLFIITHQTYELWFKQILYELDAIAGLFNADKVNDNSPALYQAFHLLNRVKTILKVAIQQIDIMETMTSLDFLDFRNYLRPASGFQSIQFKMVEALLGLEQKNRHQLTYYLSQLREEDIEKVKEVEAKRSVLELTNDWLGRMPFLDEGSYWQDHETKFPLWGKVTTHPFWSDYLQTYENSLQEREIANLDLMITGLFTGKEEARLSTKAKRSALFIILYRDYPLFQLPFQFINSLLEIDELMATWRFRHVNMVNRVIGRRSGTGGSSGKGYLEKAMQKHYIFAEFADLFTFLIERKNLPVLPKGLSQRLGYTFGA